MCVNVCCTQMAIFAETHFKEHIRIYPKQILATKNNKIKLPQSAHAVEPGALEPLKLIQHIRLTKPFIPQTKVALWNMFGRVFLFF